MPGRGKLLIAGQRVAIPAIGAAQGWRLVRAQEAAAAPQQAQGRSVQVLAASAVASALLLPLVWMLAQRLARPQRELAAALNQARERYDYEPQQIPVQSAREAVAVGQAVRAMLAQIAARQALVDDSAAGCRELFELHPLPMWVLDEESLRFLEVNAAAVRKYEYALFMIAQQALANALRHAAARRIEVSVEDRGGSIELSVRDDGVGFDHQAEPPPGHLGLVGMRERARWIGARLSIESTPGAGTTVRVHWQTV